MRIIKRSEWGARPFRTPAPHVPLCDRRWFIVHYPGLGTPPSDVGDYARWIERIHMDQNGWRGVGYNFFIGEDGDTAEGCGRDVRGSHSPPHNYDGIGVNIWTSQGQPTEAGMRAARELYEQLCDEARRTLEIGWHGMDYPTACPGPVLQKWAMAGMPVSGLGDPGTDNPTDELELDMDPKTLEKMIRKAVREESLRGDVVPRPEYSRDEDDAKTNPTWRGDNVLRILTDLAYEARAHAKDGSGKRKLAVHGNTASALERDEATADSLLRYAAASFFDQRKFYAATMAELKALRAAVKELSAGSEITPEQVEAAIDKAVADFTLTLEPIDKDE